VTSPSATYRSCSRFPGQPCTAPCNPKTSGRQRNNHQSHRPAPHAGIQPSSHPRRTAFALPAGFKRRGPNQSTIRKTTRFVQLLSRPPTRCRFIWTPTPTACRRSHPPHMPGRCSTKPSTAGGWTAGSPPTARRIGSIDRLASLPTDGNVCATSGWYGCGLCWRGLTTMPRVARTLGIATATWRERLASKGISRGPRRWHDGGRAAKTRPTTCRVTLTA